MTTTTNNTEAKLVKLMKTAAFKNECVTLLKAVEENERIVELMQPQYDELLKNFLIEYKDEKRRLAVEEGEIEMNWGRTWLLSDDCFAMLMVEKTKIDEANGFFYKDTICPILKSKDKVTESIKRLIDLHIEKVDESFKSIYYNLNLYKEFEATMIGALIRNKKK